MISIYLFFYGKNSWNSIRKISISWFDFLFIDWADTKCHLLGQPFGYKISSKEVENWEIPVDPMLNPRPLTASIEKPAPQVLSNFGDMPQNKTAFQILPRWPEKVTDRKIELLLLKNYKKNSWNKNYILYKGSLERRDKRSSWAASSSTSMASTATLIPSEANKENDVGSMLDSFPPVTLTGNTCK